MSLFYNLNESKSTENVTMKWPSDEYVIPAGTPMSRTGIANNGDAIGILAREARIEFPYPLSIAHLIGKKEPKGNQDFTFTLITGGYVNLEEVEAAFGGEISEEAKAAMADIVFVKKNIDLGGGGGDELEVVVEKTQFEGEEYELPVKPGIVFAGQTLKITFDGVAYVCEPWDGRFGFICYGNGDYDAGNVGKGDSTVPFFFDESGFLATSSGTHTVKVELPSSGGTAEIPTCTVKFVVDEYAGSNDYIAYMKHVDGVSSIVNINNDTPEEDRYEYTFENVVCDSIIYFCWWFDTNGGGIQIDGGAEQIVNNYNAEGETMLFKAQSEPNSVSTITLTGILIDDSGGWE